MDCGAVCFWGELISSAQIAEAQKLAREWMEEQKSERTEEKSTEQLAEIAKNQALMVMCLQ